MDGLEDSDDETERREVTKQAPPADDSDEDEDEEGESEEDLGPGGIDLRRGGNDDLDDSDEEEEDELAAKRKRLMDRPDVTGVAGKRGSKKARSMLSSLVHMEAQEDSDEGKPLLGPNTVCARSAGEFARRFPYLY